MHVKIKIILRIWIYKSNKQPKEVQVVVQITIYLIYHTRDECTAPTITPQTMLHMPES